MHSVNRTRRTLLLAAAALPTSSLLAKTTTETGLRHWRGYVGAPQGQVHVHHAAPQAVSDEQHSPLVCLHPTASSGIFFREFQELMATDRWVLCPDTPGYGSSDAPPEKPSIADYAEAIAGALDELKLSRRGVGPADVLGFHTGCLIAVELAASRPDLVRRLVLPGVPFYEGEERDQEYQDNARAKAYFEGPEAFADTWRKRYGFIGEATPYDRFVELFGEEIRAGRNNWWAYHAVFTYPSRERMTKARQPALVLATGGDLFEPSAQAAEILPNATLRRLPDLTAPLFHKHYREIAQVTREFLDR